MSPGILLARRKNFGPAVICGNCATKKQQQIRQLRITVRDLSISREHWKTRVQELEQRLQAVAEAHGPIDPAGYIFFGGSMDNQAMPRTFVTLSSA